MIDQRQNAVQSQAVILIVKRGRDTYSKQWVKLVSVGDGSCVYQVETKVSRQINADVA